MTRITVTVPGRREGPARRAGTALRLDDVAAQVEVQSGPHRLVSLVTREAVEDLALEAGVTVTARVKSTSVHIDLP